jgi:two-component system, sensor histidine kinase and response regulator
VDTIRPYAIQKDVDIYVNSREACEMKADPGEIEIIMNNLISNAVKYNKVGGRVDIFIEKKESLLRLTVSDTGIGLNKEDKEKIFEDFVRIKSFQTREVTGSGLGLSIVKKIVDMYQGSIDVQSEPGSGTSFIITLLEPEA